MSDRFQPARHSDMDNHPHHNQSASPPDIRTFVDNPTMPAAPDDPCFKPGHIRVDHMGRFAAILPLQILPAEHHGTPWRAENLSWVSFVVLTQQKLGTTLQNKQMLAEVGQSSFLAINEPKDWYVAMQMCHDLGLKQCVFRVLGEDVAVEPEQPVEGPAAKVQGRGRSWRSVVAAVGTVGVAAVAGALQMGYLPGLFFG